MFGLQSIYMVLSTHGNPLKGFATNKAGLRQIVLDFWKKRHPKDSPNIKINMDTGRIDVIGKHTTTLLYISIIRRVR